MNLWMFWAYYVLIIKKARFKWVTFTIANVDARIHSLYKMKIIEILISNEIKNKISTTKFIIFHCE